VAQSGAAEPHRKEFALARVYWVFRWCFVRGSSQPRNSLGRPEDLPGLATCSFLSSGSTQFALIRMIYLNGVSKSVNEVHLWASGGGLRLAWVQLSVGNHVFPPLGINTRFFQASLLLRILVTSQHHFYITYSCVLHYSFSSAINYPFHLPVKSPAVDSSAQAHHL